MQPEHLSHEELQELCDGSAYYHVMAWHDERLFRAGYKHWTTGQETMYEMRVLTRECRVGIGVIDCSLRLQ